MKRPWMELALVVAGLTFLTKAGWNTYQYRQFQKQPVLNQFAAGSVAYPRNPDVSSDHHVIIGQLRISRLHMSVLIVEGDDDESLSLAVGHMRGTALVGRKGNAVLAGHRDTVFWPLRKIKAGDLIFVSTDRKYVYSVQQTQIVDPEDTGVLDDTRNALLTMVTCYPFRHVGPAPKRFVVTAKLLNSQS